jgi:hypothetical protein
MAMLTRLYKRPLITFQKLSSKLADQPSRNIKNQPKTVKNTGAAYPPTSKIVINKD